jgi:hypothetical protein
VPTDAKPDAAAAAANLASDLSRRGFVATASAAAAGGMSLAPAAARAATRSVDIAGLPPYGNGTRPGACRAEDLTRIGSRRVGKIACSPLSAWAKAH